MKKTYIDLTESYKLVTPGVPVLIGTKGKNPGQYNLAPIAWNCPLDYEPVTKVLFVSDPAHQTALNAKREGRFAFCIPLSDSVPEIEKCGSVSDPEADKFKQFGIKGIPCEKIDALVPLCSKAVIECELIGTHREENAEIFMGRALAAYCLE